jgi:hypothetical protein
MSRTPTEEALAGGDVGGHDAIAGCLNSADQGVIACRRLRDRRQRQDRQDLLHQRLR